MFAGALPELVARSLIEHRVVERVVDEALASPEPEGQIVSAAAGTQTDTLVAQVLANPKLERLLSDALESRLTLELTDKVMQSDAFHHALTRVLSGPEVRAASQGSRGRSPPRSPRTLRDRLVRLDDVAERGPRRLFRRPPRPEAAAERRVGGPRGGHRDPRRWRSRSTLPFWRSSS